MKDPIAPLPIRAMCAVCGKHARVKWYGRNRPICFKCLDLE